MGTELSKPVKTATVVALRGAGMIPAAILRPASSLTVLFATTPTTAVVLIVTSLRRLLSAVLVVDLAMFRRHAPAIRGSALQISTFLMGLAVPSATRLSAVCTVLAANAPVATCSVSN